MTIEQKAKAYDEALKWMRSLYPTMTGIDKEDAEHYFPELRESEDERIKNLIYCLIRDRSDNRKLLEHNGIMVEKALAWLEKQGDSNNQNWKPSKEQINALEHFVRSIAESGYASPYDDSTKLLKSLINDLHKLEKQKDINALIQQAYKQGYTEGQRIERKHWLEKQDEQKPTDEEMKELLRTEYEKGRADAIAETQVAWSEEDKVMLDEIIDFFENRTVKLQHDLSLYASWLKALKQRITNKQ